jgi:predicted adenine nucleotide alpha hydrolase (AANH) superfamily ATPase
MKLLLHICCGPCAVYPLKRLRASGVEVVGFFSNPNIHPFTEFERRVQALETVADRFSLPVYWDPGGYGFSRWLERMDGGYGASERCPQCYRIRLEAAARKAADLGLPSYTTTLLYSRYQRHDLIRELGEGYGAFFGVSFHYEDFREGWQEGIETSLALGIYRQPYCGCIFSEEERYAKRARRLARRLIETPRTAWGQEASPELSQSGPRKRAQTP